MVDFNSLLAQTGKNGELDPIKIFESAPKSGRFNDLYSTQANILREWNQRLRDTSDVVIELNTGGGKTLVGLLMGISLMRELHEGTLFLVENKQLAHQVLAQAKELNLPAREYCGGKSVDASFSNGECLLVGSYQALFNGRSVFGLADGSKYEPIGAIIIDDAHASLNSVTEAFSLDIPFSSNGGLYADLLRRFEIAFKEMDKTATYDDFLNGMGDSVLEVPFWHWTKELDFVYDRINSEFNNLDNLDNHEFSNQLKFKWPLLRNNLKYCEAVIDGSAFGIRPLYPLIDEIPSFKNAKRRIFMSATLSNYDDLIRTFDTRELSKEAILAPSTVAGVGRRMLLSIPENVMLSDELVALVKEVSDEGIGIVRLSSQRCSDELKRKFHFIEPLGNEEVKGAIERLNRGDMNQPVSIINRYNGIDLPDDSCRILIVDGLPIETDSFDKLEMIRQPDSPINGRRIAQKIEQGVGRGVRGASDYCVVLLRGYRLNDWINRNSHRMLLSDALQAQLKIGDEITNQVKSPSEYCDLIRQGLRDESAWQQFHATRLQEHLNGGSKDGIDTYCEIAKIERRAFALWREHSEDSACSKLECWVKNNEAEVSDAISSRLLALAARISFSKGEIGQAEKYQKKAHSFAKTTVFVPFANKELTSDWISDQANSIWLSFRDQKHAGLPSDQFDSSTAALVWGHNHVQFEESLMQLGRFLGFDSNREDKNGSGPDVVWINKNGQGFVLEAKNEKNKDKPLTKNEAGQLRTAVSWLKSNNPTLREIVPVSVHPNVEADSNASAADLFVMTPETLSNLKRAVRDMALAIERGRINNSEELARYIREHSSEILDIKGSYLTHFNDSSSF